MAKLDYIGSVVDMVFRALLVLLSIALFGLAQEYAPDVALDHPAIKYFENPVNDVVSKLAKDVESGKVSLEHRGGLSWLPSVLQRLGINLDSQALVFSRTSVQAAKVAPNHPRAIYFADNVAVAFVPGSDEIELAATDPRQGVVFYSLNIKPAEKPAFVRGTICVKCHQGPATSGVPGMFVGSVFPNALGNPAKEGAIITDHRTKFEDRWGGWYVNAKRGQQKDRANAVASNPAEPTELDTEGQQNLTTLIGKFNPEGYLTPISDMISLMTFEHQTQMTNFITRVGWQARITQQEGKTDEFSQAKLEAEIDALVTYMLFIDEEPLPAPVEGVSTFTKTFPQRGPRDHVGRSLRDFDLQKRLFRFPLSYMVYSESFDALPGSVRERIYQRLYDILTGKDTTPKFAKIAQADRQAIIEILRETKPALPAYWRR